MKYKKVNGYSRYAMGSDDCPVCDGRGFTTVANDEEVVREACSNCLDELEHAEVELWIATKKLEDARPKYEYHRTEAMKLDGIVQRLENARMRASSKLEKLKKENGNG